MYRKARSCTSLTVNIIIFNLATLNYIQTHVTYTFILQQLKKFIGRLVHAYFVFIPAMKDSERYIFYLEVCQNECDSHSLEPSNIFRPFTEITDCERLHEGG